MFGRRAVLGVNMYSIVCRKASLGDRKMIVMCVVDNLDETSPYHHGYRKSLNAHGGDGSNGMTSRQTNLVVT